MVKIILLCVLAAFLVFFLIPEIIMGKILHHAILIRDKEKKKWARECSAPDDPEAVRMFDQGMAWAEAHAGCRQEVSVVSDGLKLVGEYFDFGFKKAVIVIPGRTESLLFSYYFGACYEKYCNVLVIDNRSHGNSEGRVNNLGFREYRDILVWGKLLHEKFGNEKVWLHGICVGCGTSIYALTAPQCPDYFAGAVCEGAYDTFYHTFQTHMVNYVKPIYPLIWFAMLWIHIYSGKSPIFDGPLYRADKLKKPILFLHSRTDGFSLPKYMDGLYARCAGDKKLVWFDSCKHSRIRINYTEDYDREIFYFIEK